jgi:serine/threonine-protein phosphatase PGAM5
MIFLIRHGQYNRELRDGGLTNSGIIQAMETGKFLSNFPFSKILTSEMLRAKETSNIIKKYININYSESMELLNEISLSSIMVETNYPGRKLGENAYERFIQRIYTHGNILLITHGNVIRFFICKLINLDLGNIQKLDCFNCAISIFTRINDELILVTYNSVLHLSHDLWTRD